MIVFPETYVKDFHDVDCIKKMEYRTLGDTGLMVSKLSLGLSAIGSVFRSTDDSHSWDVVEYAIKSGINWIDGAPWYGHGKAEIVFGEAIQKKQIPRKAFYLATKVGRYAPDIEKMFDFSAERVTRSVDESLKRLGVDYVDLIQVHDMEFAPSVDIIVNETLPALQKLKESGKVKMIGLTGYPLQLFKTVIERSSVNIDAILTYCHYCLNDTSLLKMLPYFESKKIAVINASPTGMGLLTNRGTPSWHPATEEIKASCKKAATYCEKEGVEISKLALHFTCSNPNIPTTLASTASLVNLKNNLDSVLNNLTDHERKVMKTVQEKYLKGIANQTWEDIEVTQYWNEFNSMQK